MFLIELLIRSIVCLVMIGLDVVSFFVVVRILVLRWPRRPLQAVDQVGRPVTDPLLVAVGRAVPHSWFDDNGQREHIAAGATLLGLAVCRLTLAGLIA